MKRVFSFLLIFAMIAALGISAFAEGVTLSLTQSTAAEQLIFAVPEGETITGVSLQGGALPTGMTVSHSMSAVSISGTPTIVGNYSATIKITGETAGDVATETKYLVTVNASVVPASTIVINGGETAPTPTPEVTGVPQITKHPTAENVATGDRAVFIARADGADMITWYIKAPDGTVYPASSFATYFPGVTVSGDGTEKLILSNVNTKLTGLSAYAAFTNPFGSVNSDAAMINVTAATPSPVPTVAPTPTPKPVATPQPTVAPTPRAEVTPTPTDIPVQEANADKDKDRDRDRDDDAIRHSHSGAGAIIATVLVGLLTIAIAVVLVMYVKGKIDLSWLEDWINRRNDKK